MKYEVPTREKSNLTLEEAVAYSGIGVNKLWELTNRRGCRMLILRRQMPYKRRL